MDFNDITWYGHASFSFLDNASGQRIYYIDPFELPDRQLEKADLVFITHAHHDHLSPDDIGKILKTDTAVIATSDSLERLEVPESFQFSVVPNQAYTVKNYSFETVPAYNNHADRVQFHPQENNWVGYILTINGKKIYHAGDTDFIPEMERFKDMNIDIAFLPIGGTYTMDVDEAIDAANAIGAKVTVPMHYKMLLKDNVGRAEERLREGVKNSQVIILEEFR